MKRLIKNLIVLAATTRLLLIASSLFAIEPASNPALATVRIKSHGCSATIIATMEGKSWILGCAHMLADDKGNPSPTMRARNFSSTAPISHMLDKFGRELKLGDKVIIEAQVATLYPREPCINLKVRLLEPRPTTDGSEHRDAFYIHSKTVRKVDYAIRRNL